LIRPEHIWWAKTVAEVGGGGRMAVRVGEVEDNDEAVVD